MANRSKTLSFRAKTLKACWRRELLTDRFSLLPDEIIVSVLSLLTMKEAGRTSVLSKRWRYVWAYIPELNFDASDTLYKTMLDRESLEVEIPRYLRWVDQVVGSYKGQTIDEFRVRFDIDVNVNSEYSLDNWVNFAMEKKVKRLEMNFNPCARGIHDKCYTFCGFSISNSITSLKLVSVDVTGEVLQKFLENCTGLEHLSVESSKSLVNLEVVGKTLNLKYLEIWLCHKINHLEIVAPNLVSVKYFGPKISMPFKSTPKLSTLFIGGYYCEYLTNNFLELSSFLFQLEELSLRLPFGVKYGMKSVDQFSVCKRLKQLELIVHPLDDEDLFCFSPLIKACPFLHKFVLKFTWHKPGKKRKRIEIEACHLEHLKIIEIVGFVGHAIDMEFIMYLIASCVELEKIVIDLCTPVYKGTPWEFGVKKERRRSRKVAEKLRAVLAPGVEFIFI